MARVSRMELSQGEVVQCVSVHLSGALSPCHIIAKCVAGGGTVRTALSQCTLTLRTSSRSRISRSKRSACRDADGGATS